MTIRDLLKMEIDVDVLDDYSDDLWIAFGGSLNLTDVGERKFATVLDLPVELNEDEGTACVLLNDYPDCERLERNCIRFFEAAAGFCSAKDCDEWFYTVDRPFGANV